MILIDLPRAVLGGVLRVARLPLDLVFGSSPNGASETAPERTETEEHPTETAEQREQAEALRRAVDGHR